MARKQTVQLQADLQSDEEFDKFLEMPGLLVIDVYTNWCGPCLGMLGGLRKIKLEQGESLNLAIAKSDTISYVNRFYKKSEPTWLFVAQGRAINIMFGADYPQLMKLISDETRSLGRTKERETYSISEMQPKEIEIDNIRNAAERARIQREHAENERKKIEYFNFVTTSIHKNLPDIGITIFGPHLHRDTFRHLIEYAAEKFNMQLKDRRVQPITKEQFDYINSHCENPLAAEVIEALDGKDLFICFWRVENEKEPILEVLHKFVDSITKLPDLSRESEDPATVKLPPYIVDTKMEIPYDLKADEICSLDDAPESLQQDDESVKSTATIYLSEEESEGEMLDNAEGGAAGDPMFDGLDVDSNDKLSRSSKNSQITIKSKKLICMRKVTIPAVWLPKDWRTHAAIIYKLFRAQTESFLPPDPVPEPPHVIMAFDTHKKADLIEFAERNPKDIPLYGFFTSDEIEEAKHIASSKQNYAQQKQAVTDKLIFKVNKTTSHTMLSLVTYGPTYVSQNTTIGAHDAKILFPEGYVSAEKEQLESKLVEKPKAKKRSSKAAGTGSVKAQDSNEVVQQTKSARGSVENGETQAENVPAPASEAAPASAPALDQAATVEQAEPNAQEIPASSQAPDAAVAPVEVVAEASLENPVTALPATEAETAAAAAPAATEATEEAVVEAPKEPTVAAEQAAAESAALPA